MVRQDIENVPAAQRAKTIVDLQGTKQRECVYHQSSVWDEGVCL